MQTMNDDRRSQRGFSLIDMLVWIGLVSVTLLGFGYVYGMQPPGVRSSALEFGAALVETRPLAVATAAEPVLGAASSGATLAVVPDGRGGSLVTVYRSRPVPNAAPPVVDSGFAPIHLPAPVGVVGRAAVGRPFTLYVSSAAYLSVDGTGSYDPARPRIVATDPGCNERTGELLEVGEGRGAQAYRLDCRDAALETDTPLKVPTR